MSKNRHRNPVYPNIPPFSGPSGRGVADPLLFFLPLSPFVFLPVVASNLPDCSNNNENTDKQSGSFPRLCCAWLPFFTKPVVVCAIVNTSKIIIFFGFLYLISLSRTGKQCLVFLFWSCPFIVVPDRFFLPFSASFVVVLSTLFLSYSSCCCRAAAPHLSGACRTLATTLLFTLLLVLAPSRMARASKNNRRKNHTNRENQQNQTGLEFIKIRSQLCCAG